MRKIRGQAFLCSAPISDVTQSPHLVNLHAFFSVLINHSAFALLIETAYFMPSVVVYSIVIGHALTLAVVVVTLTSCQLICILLSSIAISSLCDKCLFVIRKCVKYAFKHLFSHSTSRKIFVYKNRKNKSVCLNHDVLIAYFMAFNRQKWWAPNTDFERIMLSSVLSIAMAPIVFIDHFELSVLLMYY